MAYCKVEREIFGQKWTIETGKMAKQADGAVVVTYGETKVLTAVQSADPRPGIDFFPLTVDYRERTAASGKFPGGFFKREGRPTQKEILTMRLTDRHVRPLFADGYNDEVQIMSLVLSADMKNDPDILSMIGTSAALSVSKIPFLGPTGAVRVGYKDGAYLLNPLAADREVSQMDLVVAGTNESVCMVEAGVKELEEQVVLDGIAKGHEFIKEMTAMISELQEKAGVAKNDDEPPAPDEVLDELNETYSDKIRECLQVAGKHEKSAAVKKLREEFLEAKTANIEDEEQKAQEIKALKKSFGAFTSLRERRIICEEKVRSDGRGLTDIRPIDVEVGFLPRTHGSALFTRGETQAIVSLTLGTSSDAQLIEGLDTEYYQKFMLHYTFPPYSVGEVRPIRGPGRREIGHGALAERGILPILPDPEDFYYTIRIASDILESNGSSSMASVCGGTMALMDGGVPIKRPVAGIAMGLIKEGDEVLVLSDILGSEDHNGDMDFKVVGSGTGITALQMDIKIKGITIDVMNEALMQAKEGRKHILRCMMEALDSPRERLSAHAPKMLRKMINPEKIGTLIGPGGRMIKKIQEEASVKIDVDDSGEVLISGLNQDSVEQAYVMVEAVTDDVEVGKIYKGKIVSIKDFGVFMEILPGQEGLCHVSELSEDFVKNVSDVVQFGEIHDVKVINIDDSGRIKLSITQAKEDQRRQ